MQASRNSYIYVTFQYTLMDFRDVLRKLDKLQEENYQGITSREFAETSRMDISPEESKVYLHRLYKMNLASRRIDANAITGRGRRPYRYRLSKQGESYLNYLSSPKARVKDKGLVRVMTDLLNAEKAAEAVELFQSVEKTHPDDEELYVARQYYYKALSMKTK